MQSLRASRSWEIYNNTYQGLSGQSWVPGFIRGGTGVIWGNTMTGAWSSGGVFTLDNVRSFDPAGRDYGACNGSSTADGNSLGNGWPCRDQIGRGKDACVSTPSNTSTSASGWCAQASEPAYFWLNTVPGGGIMVPDNNNGTTAWLVANRDYYYPASSFTGASGTGSGTLANRPSTCTTGVAYWATDQGEWNSAHAGPDGQLYKCVSTNTWSLYYTPFVYPHPLSSGQTTIPVPTVPSNLRIVGMD